MSIRNSSTKELSHFIPHEALARSFSGKTGYFLILDRDGTLVPIADRPEDAILKPRKKAFLHHLVTTLPGHTAVVSARGLGFLKNDFNSFQTILAGNYGLELSFPNGLTFVHPEAEKVKDIIAEVHSQISSSLCVSEDVLLDYHVFSLCLHFHQVPDHRLKAVHEVMLELSREHASLVFRLLPTSYDILPSFAWDKGEALNFIATQQPELLNYFPIAIGDSENDEPMFKWANERGGLSLRVGATTDGTAAELILDSEDDVYVLLERLLAIRSGREFGSLASGY